MSNTVIKAFSTRLLPPEERPAAAGDAPEENGAYEISEAEREEERRRAAYQAAYDEVIEAAQQEVALLLEDARRQARKIIDGAAVKAEEMRETARTEGFESGRSDGYADAFEKTERELEELLKNGQAGVDAVLAEAYKARDAMLLEMEPKILRLALDVAEKILGYELDQNNAAFLSIVTAALNVIQCESRVTLRVNAEEFTGVFHSKSAAHLKTERGGVEADIQADAGVEPRGCLIMTGNGTVDASVSAQLEQISKNMGLE
ncbi:MAG: hypothetical protein LBH95_04545 [Oscillospiraceae bacterium]|nr:hypothetical protein [Oscillospiraceae bacterium]